MNYYCLGCPPDCSRIRQAAFLFTKRYKKEMKKDMVWAYLNLLVVIVLHYVTIFGKHLPKIPSNSHSRSTHLILHVPNPFSCHHTSKVGLNLDNQLDLSHSEPLLKSHRVQSFEFSLLIICWFWATLAHFWLIYILFI